MSKLNSSDLQRLRKRLDPKPSRLNEHEQGLEAIRKGSFARGQSTSLGGYGLPPGGLETLFTEMIVVDEDCGSKDGPLWKFQDDNWNHIQTWIGRTIIRDDGTQVVITNGNIQEELKAGEMYKVRTSLHCNVTKIDKKFICRSCLGGRGRMLSGKRFIGSLGELQSESEGK